MSQKTRSIKVIIHAPEDEDSLLIVKRATDELYAKIITDELAKSDLTYDEKQEVLFRLSAKIDSRNNYRY